LLPSGAPVEPSSPEFATRVAKAAAVIGRVNVAAVYLVHGTFAGNDALGLLTELSRWAPGASESLRRLSKGVVDFVAREMGNYTPAYAARLEQILSDAAGRVIPVRRFDWSSQDNHIGRADGAVRLVDELANLALTLSNRNSPAPSPVEGRAGEGGDAGTRSITPPHQGEGSREKHLPSRILLWAHSHGGNVLALASNMLGGDNASRREFFHAARSFYRQWRSSRVDLPAWQRVEDLLMSSTHPLRKLQLDMVTFGTPVRYGWETSGYAKLLHVINHRPFDERRDWLAPFPPRWRRVLRAADGDFVQQVGIAGSGLPHNPLAFRTIAANRRLRKFLAGDVPGWFISRLRAQTRVPNEGLTLLVDYADPAIFPTHLFGHAAYTRSRWLPLHLEMMAQEFYSASPDWL
jgi:hypothetical protein